MSHGSVNAAIEEIEDCDLVFLQTCWNVRLLAVMAGEYCRLSGKPLVTALHTTGHCPRPATIELHDHWFREILNSSTHVVCVSDDVKKSIEPYIDEFGLATSVINNASRFLDRRQHMLVINRTERKFLMSAGPPFQKG